MTLFLYEVKKLWSRKDFLLYFALLICVNIFLIWYSSQPAANTPPPKAYKQFTQELKGMSEEEKVRYVQARFDTISAIVTMDSIMKNYQYNPQESQKLIDGKYKNMFEVFGETYRQNTYLRYTDNLYTEYYFLQKMNDEIAQSAGYEDFLREIQQKAQQLSQISIFNKEGSYDSLNIKATAEAYRDISGIEIEYFPQEGVVKAISFRYSDLVLVFIMLLLAGFIVREEKDSGMLTLIRTTPAGRVKTAAAKLGAMAISLLAAVSAIYIVNLLFCNFTYGLGSLTASIQSIPYLMRSTMRINFLQYLAIFVFTKWIAAFICGVWVLFGMLTAKRIFTGYALALAMPTLNLLIRNAIPATSHLNVIKYSNLVSFLTTNEILGGYRNIYWFGKPVRLFWVEITAAVIFAGIFTALFLITFEKAQLAKSEGKKFSFGFKKKFKATTVFRQEMYKQLVMNGGIFVLTLFVAFQAYNAYKAENYITADEMFYSYYMKQLTGPYDSRAYEFMTREYEKFKPLVRAQERASYGIISQEEYSAFVSANYSLNMEYGVYQKVTGLINSLRQNPGAQLIYDTGYIKLFDFADVMDLKDYLFTVLVACVSFAGLFCMEKSSGMLKVIKSTSLGMEHTAKAKIRTACLLSSVITLVSAAPRFYQVWEGYGFKGLFVPAKSIYNLADMNRYIPVIAVILFMLAARFLVTFTMSVITLYISQKSENYLSAVMFSLLILEFPALLYYLGVKWAGWLTLYPLFHIVGSYGKTSFIVNLGYIALAVCGINYCAKYLVKEYSVQ